MEHDVLAINGSHRAENGITDIVVHKLLEGAEPAGANCEILYPAKMKIAPCAACHKCILETPGVCRHEDDMAWLIPRLDSADTLVFASPVYFDTMSSQMKKMFERLIPAHEHFFEYRAGRAYHPRKGTKKPRVVTISVCGNPGRENFASINRTFERIVDNMGGDLLGEFCFPASHLIAANPDLVRGQLAAVYEAGKEMCAGPILERTLNEANREYVDEPEEVIRQINRIFLEIRKYHGL